MKDLFGKSIEFLEETDLDILINRPVPEGLFMDYKLDFPSSKNLQRIVASFANTYGGWIIIGADANNPSNVPTDFPGIELIGENQRPQERFRDICLNISPIPQFVTKLISKAGGTREILVIYIEESPTPPHITYDGRIYRRNAEGLDPIPETDRHMLDLLYQKAQASSIQLQNELLAANITREYFGHTIVVHPEPVRILIPDLFARHEGFGSCKGDYLLGLYGTGGKLLVGQDWIANRRDDIWRINTKGCISRSVFLSDSPLKEHRPANIPPINENHNIENIEDRLTGLLKLADKIYKELHYYGNCRIVFYLNGMRGVGLTAEGVSDGHRCREDNVIVPLLPFSIRASQLSANIDDYIKLIMLEVWHSFGHPVWQKG